MGPRQSLTRYPQGIRRACVDDGVRVCIQGPPCRPANGHWITFLLLLSGRNGWPRIILMNLLPAAACYSATSKCDGCAIASSLQSARSTYLHSNIDHRCESNPSKRSKQRVIYEIFRLETTPIGFDLADGAARIPLARALQFNFNDESCKKKIFINIQRDSRRIWTSSTFQAGGAL